MAAESVWSFSWAPGDVVTTKPRHREWYVYTLEESNTGNVRYVGKTYNPRLRLMSHLTDKHASRPFRAWRIELKSASARPVMRIESVHETEAEALVAEELSIQRHLLGGDDLINIRR